MSTRQFFSIGKDILNTIIYPIKLKREKKISLCSSCNFLNSTDEYSIRYCNEYCHKKNNIILVNNLFNKKIKKTKFKVVNFDIKKLHIYNLKKIMQKKETYLTASQIKVLITYYNLSNKNGIINLFKISELAKIIGCSVNTIKNANKKLEQYNFIKFQETNNKLTVIINSSKDYYKKDGPGYILFSKRLLNSLYKITNTHKLRIIIKVILNFDANNHFNNKTLLSYEKIKVWLPKYKQKRFALNDFIQSLINLKIDGLKFNKHMFSSIDFNLNDEYNGKIEKQNIINKNMKLLLKFASKEKLLFTNRELVCEKLAEISINYDIEEIKYILKNTSNEILFSPVSNVLKYVNYHLRSKDLLLV